MRFFRRACLAAFLLLSLSAALTPVAAAEGEPSLFDAFGIAVDVTADTAASARAQALAEAERRAFAIVMARLTLSESAADTRFADADIARLTREFWISSEKRSATRYIATVNYTFRPERVRQLLRRYNVPFVEDRSLPQLVLPVLRDGDSVILWERPNPWWQAWQTSTEPSLVPFVLPEGDAVDGQIVSATDADAGNVDALKAIADRYGCASVVVATVRLGVAAEPAPTALDAHGNIAEVLIQVVDAETGTETPATSLPFERIDASPEVAFAAAATAVRRAREQDWIRDNVLRRHATALLTVAITIDGLRSWNTIRKQLLDIPEISRIDVIAMSPHQVTAHVVHHATIEEVSRRLDERRMRLRQDDAGNYTIEKAMAPSAVVPRATAVPRAPL